MAAAESLTLEEQVARVREQKDAKAKAKAEVAAKREIEEFALEEQFETKTGGKRSEKFEIIDFGADVGFVVVERGPAVLYRRLLESKVEQGDVSTFVLPQVSFPEKDRFKELALEFHGMWNKCCDELCLLHKFRKSAIAGKA